MYNTKNKCVIINAPVKTINVVAQPDTAPITTIRLI